MPTDIKLDEVDGNWLIVESGVLKSTATDFMLDAPARRRPTGGHRRALVHGEGDKLIINCNGDYPSGTTVHGNLTVTGQILTADGSSDVDELKRAVSDIRDQLRRMHSGAISEVADQLKALAALLNAAFVPPWKTREEVENGDDMGVFYESAASLGLVVEYRDEQGVPGYFHDQVIRIEPRPGTPLLRGSTVRVTVNYGDSD